MGFLKAPDERISKVLKYLGIDPKETIKAVITFEMDAAVTVELTRLVKIEGEGKELETKTFNLIPIEKGITEE